jgi:hypothetical protein
MISELKSVRDVTILPNKSNFILLFYLLKIMI